MVQRLPFLGKLFRQFTTSGCSQFLDMWILFSAKLPSGVAAIYPEIRTRHEPAGIAEEEHGRTPVVLGLAQLVEHVVRRPLLFTLWELLEKLLNHLRDN
jgi:hypothetical protein